MNLSLNEIVLTEEQTDAVNRILQFLNSDDVAISLNGSAGVGKTFVIKYVLNEIKDIMPYCLCAPTHKAALVLHQSVNEETITLHALLALSPKLDVLQLDLRDLGFNSGNSKFFPKEGLVICDEASMVNDDLYEFLIKKAKENKSKLLFVLDEKQLAPVKNETKSKVCDLTNGIFLTKIFRQNQESALIPLLETLRNNYITKFETKICNNGSVYTYTNPRIYIDKVLDLYKQAIQEGDILKVKILAYTNNRIDQYNNVIHKLLFKDDEEFHKDGFITCHENISRDNYKYWNSMDYIICENPRKIEITIPYFDKILPGYLLTIKDPLTQHIGCIKVLSSSISPDILESLASKIERLRISAIKETVKIEKVKKWKMYFRINDSFISQNDLMYNDRLIRKRGISHGYAITVHKSQGSSLQDVFIDMKNILRQGDPEELRQLEYVALSRTRNDVHMLIL